MAKGSGGSSFSWFLAGLGLGSLLGVLYAPRAGYETREELVSTALGSGDYLRQRSKDVQDAAGQYVERGKGQVNEYVSRGKGQVNDYVNRGKDQVNEYVNRGKDQVNDYVARGKDAVEAGRQKINEAYNQGRQAVADQKEKVGAAIDAASEAYQTTTAAPVERQEIIPASTESSS